MTRFIIHPITDTEVRYAIAQHKAFCTENCGLHMDRYDTDIPPYIPAQGRSMEPIKDGVAIGPYLFWTIIAAGLICLAFWGGIVALAWMGGGK